MGRATETHSLFTPQRERFHFAFSFATVANNLPVTFCLLELISWGLSYFLSFRQGLKDPRKSTQHLGEWQIFASIHVITADVIL